MRILAAYSLGVLIGFGAGRSITRARMIHTVWEIGAKIISGIEKDTRDTKEEDNVSDWYAGAAKTMATFLVNFHKFYPSGIDITPFKAALDE